MITIEDFAKVEMRAGKVLSAEPVEGSEKLLKLSVDFGSASAEGFGGTKQVLSGIAKFISPEEITGVICAFVTNLEPREIMGQKSEAMIMALSGDLPDGSKFFSLLKVSENTPPGSAVR